MPVSQNGYSANDRSLMRRIVVGGVGAWVRKGPAGDLLAYAATRWNSEVEPLRAPDGVLDFWGYAPRPIIGSTTLSNHASGTALDLRARIHPLGRSGTFRPEQVAAIRRILGDCRGALRWGGDYSSRKDEMHVEVVVGEGRVRDVLASLDVSIQEDDDMPSADEVAAAVWRFGIRNGFGDTVQAQQILVGSELRTADVQQQLAALAGQVALLRAEGVESAEILRAVRDALAADPLSP